ncbi:MAG: hypothetical protein CMM78_10855 [Rhodospirillaceae bacterium]|jgi:hypothetical protein|uniref:hypothetical protein n=1 Tax=unclassified Hwanghaeella TaxID=2605944 RepID=UPI000C5AD4CC|nr:hypothetical protein [Rhodospirillales bacterium]MAX48698.1 hypothetical protein [Rhodospirillaceae bacterium]|tara:strand:- start:328 stop:681 length:354 start_codon:yes stop_codon:yes gene_type:complete
MKTDLVRLEKSCHNRDMKMIVTIAPGKLLIAVALCAGVLSACAEPPTTTGTLATPLSKDPRVALCYSASNTTREALAELALEACPDETRRVEVWDHDTFFNDCPINKKNRVTYRCLK